MGTADFEFWVAVGPLRCEYLATACRLVEAWSTATDGPKADALFVELSRTALCLTRTDLTAVLALADDVLARVADEDRITKRHMLRALEDRINALPDGLDP